MWDLNYRVLTILTVRKNAELTNLFSVNLYLHYAVQDVLSKVKILNDDQ